VEIRRKTFEEFQDDFDKFKSILPPDLAEDFSYDEDSLRELFFSEKFDEVQKIRNDFFLKVLRRIKSVERALDQNDIEKFCRLRKHLDMLHSSSEYVKDIGQKRVSGYPLRITQQMAAMGFNEWIKDGLLQRPLKGHLVLPTGAGKTLTAAILAQMTGGRTVMFAHNNNTGVQIIKDFIDHQATLPNEEQKSVGQCFGKTDETDKDIVVGGFQSAHRWLDKIDWSSVRLIICDEADINALSNKRRKLIEELSTKYGIVLVGMSATEEQGSGKRLQDAFPDEIVRLPMPDALPRCLEMGIIPQMQFYDIYFDLELKVDKRGMDLRRDILDEEVENFIRCTGWNGLLLDHYEQNFRSTEEKFEAGLVVFRNNFLVENFIDQALKRGIRAAAYTQQTSLEEREALRAKLSSGELDLLVGSQLLGRGLDIPEVNVVYNSCVTFSPQIFWQADGRGARINQNDLGKVAKIYAVLPKHIKDMDTLDELMSHERPLCHAAFFMQDYFKGEERVIDLDKDIGVKMKSDEEEPQAGQSKPKGNGVHYFDLSKYKVIRSVKEVASVVNGLWDKPIDFKGRADTLAELIGAYSETKISYGQLIHLARVRNKIALRIAEGLQRTDDSDLTDKPREELSPVFDNLPEVHLTLSEEIKLLASYKEGKDSRDTGLKDKSKRARDLLIKAHLPLVVSLANNLADDRVDVDDLIQEGLLGLCESIDRHQSGFKGRLISYAIHPIYHRMNRFKKSNSRNVRLPEYVHNPAEKIFKAIDFLTQELGGLPTVEEIAEKIGVTTREIRSIMDAYSASEHLLNERLDRNSSMRLIDREGRNITFEDILHDEFLSPTDKTEVSSDEAYEISKLNNLSARVIKVLTTIKPQEESVLRSRFGIGGDEKTAEQVGKELSLTRSRIRQIEGEALRRLRHPFRSKRLRALCDQTREYSEQKIIDINNTPHHVLKTLPYKEEFVIRVLYEIQDEDNPNPFFRSFYAQESLPYTQNEQETFNDLLKVHKLSRDEAKWQIIKIRKEKFEKKKQEALAKFLRVSIDEVDAAAEDVKEKALITLNSLNEQRSRVYLFMGYKEFYHWLGIVLRPIERAILTNSIIIPERSPELFSNLAKHLGITVEEARIIEIDAIRKFSDFIKENFEKR